ncbi:cytidylate kinase [Fervidicella metallireducens AeB]|uniref:Cytidylate kinase n=1 Tax=Fervidicella metallireducens AeB TaxID=1403537 RepID=A0A017RUV0_9CLOT|nr:(d)CMP kinase [Fervidicella metallireducens]EYE88391.1 cytidylate kinase [Fervidicella metallireducens AeB]
MKKIVVAIDGPAGAGKSTISKLVAQKLGIEYIDTGAMYRAVTLKIIRNKIDVSDDVTLEKMLNSTEITLENGKVYLDGEDVSTEIRQLYVSGRVSEIAAKQVVRDRLVELQRKMALSKNVIMDGRDIGTVVLKDANYKIYLTASVEERAARRYKEFCQQNSSVTFQEICNDIKERDRIDMNRSYNPLVKAEDAILIDTTGKSIDEVVDEILLIIKNN